MIILAVAFMIGWTDSATENVIVMPASEICTT